MSGLKVPFKLKLRIATKSLVFVLSRPAYLLTGLLSGWLALGLLVWLTNFSLLWSVLNSGLSLGGKFNFIWEGYKSLLTNFEPLAAAAIVLISLLFGLNAAVLAFIMRSRLATSAADRSRSLIGVIAGAIGAGCAACGTSILAPVLGGLGAGASLTLASWIGIFANLLAVVLLFYSIFRLSGNASTPIAQIKLAKKSADNTVVDKAVQQ